jgi:uncharacterized protein (DUF1778 family)
MKPTRNNEEKADARIYARMNANIKQRIQHAADLRGLDMSAYIVSTLAAAADETIHEHEFMELSHSDREAFANAILNPQPPNQHLLAAAKRYKDRTTN